MSYHGFQVHNNNSVRDDPRVAYALMSGTLLPRDAELISKDLEMAIGAAYQFHTLAHLTKRNKVLKKLLKMNEELKAQANEAQAEAEKYKKDAGQAKSSPSATKKKIEELKANQKKLVDEADAKGYKEGIDEATSYYKSKVAELHEKACTAGYKFGLDTAGIPEGSPLYEIAVSYDRIKKTHAAVVQTLTVQAKDPKAVGKDTTEASKGSMDPPADPSGD